MTDAHPPAAPQDTTTSGQGGEACPSWCVAEHTPERDKYGATHQAPGRRVEARALDAAVQVNVFTTPALEQAGVHLWGGGLFTPVRPGARSADLDADSAHAVAGILAALLNGLTGQPGERKATRAEYASAVARVHQLAGMIRAGAEMLDEAADPARRALRPPGQDPV